MTQAAWFCSVSSFLRPVPLCRSVGPGLGSSSQAPVPLLPWKCADSRIVPMDPGHPREHIVRCATLPCRAVPHRATSPPSLSPANSWELHKLFHLLPSPQRDPNPLQPHKGLGGLSASAPSLLPWPRLPLPVPELTEAGARSCRAGALPGLIAQP